MDDQTLTVVVVYLWHIGIDGNGRQLAHNVEPFAQGLIDICIIRIRIVIIQGNQGMLQLIHQIFPGQTQEVHFQEFVRQIIAALEYLTECVKLFTRGQVAKEQEKTGFFIEKTVVFFPFNQTTYVNTAIIQDTITVYFVVVFVPFVADDISNPCQANQHAGVVFITQSAFDAKFRKPFAGNLCVILWFAKELGQVNIFVHETPLFPAGI